MAVTTELTVQDIQAVNQTVLNYQSKCKELHTQLIAKIQEIAGSSFIGDSEKGYFTDTNSFFHQIEPNLTTQVDNLVNGLSQLLTQVQKNLLDTPDGTDPQIGAQNRSTGAEADAQTVAE